MMKFLSSMAASAVKIGRSALDAGKRFVAPALAVGGLALAGADNAIAGGGGGLGAAALAQVSSLQSDVNAILLVLVVVVFALVAWAYFKKAK